MDKLGLLTLVEKAVKQILRRCPIQVRRVVSGTLSSVPLGSVHVRASGLDFHGAFSHRRYLQALREGRQEPYMAELFKASIRAGMTVCDVGAHIGYYSLVAARQLGSSGQVYAFEPDPRNFRYLIRNIRANQLDKFIVATETVLCDRKGEVMFYLHGGDQSRSGIFQALIDARPSKVRCITLDDCLAPNETVNIVKLDVEGSELLALEG